METTFVAAVIVAAVVFIRTSIEKGLKKNFRGA